MTVVLLAFGLVSLTIAAMVSRSAIGNRDLPAALGFVVPIAIITVVVAGLAAGERNSRRSV